MFVSCINVMLHWEDLDPCNDCGTIICSQCNPGPRCAQGCGPESDEQSMQIVTPEPETRKRKKPPGISTEDALLPSQRFRVQSKRRRRVLLFEEEDTMSFDTLRPGPEGVPFYAKVVDIERQWRRDALVAHHLILEAMHAQWFDERAEDLHDLPAYMRWPASAGKCKLDMVLDTSVHETFLNHLTMSGVELEEGLWLQIGLGLHDGEHYVRGIPVRIYLPPKAPSDRKLVDLASRYTDNHVILSVDAVPHDSRMGQKLDLFTQRQT